jgi:hypothetical protein
LPNRVLDVYTAGQKAIHTDPGSGTDVQVFQNINGTFREIEFDQTFPWSTLSKAFSKSMLMIALFILGDVADAAIILRS